MSQRARSCVEIEPDLMATAMGEAEPAQLSGYDKIALSVVRAIHLTATVLIGGTYLIWRLLRGGSGNTGTSWTSYTAD